jgi:hypothetical protein
VRHVYIYYRVDPAQTEKATRAVDALLAMLAPHCNKPPRRLTRCDEPELWMEMYEGISDFSSFTRQIEEATRALGCHGFIKGERHLESFCVPLN